MRHLNPVPRNELEQPEDDCRIGIELRRVTQEHSVARDRKFSIREPGAILAEVLEQRIVGPLGCIERSARLVEDHSRVAKILAHPLSRFLAGYEGLLGETVLGVEIEHILVLPGLVMEKAARRGWKVAGWFDFLAGRTVLRVELGQPVDQTQIAETPRCLFHVRLQVMAGVLILGVARSG